MSLLATALQDAGGTAAPRERAAQLRDLLRDELARSERELGLPRSGRDEPVTVVFAAAPGRAARGRPGAGRRARRPRRGAPSAAGSAPRPRSARSSRSPGSARRAAPATCAWRPARSAGTSRCACPRPAPGDDDAELAAVAFEEHAAAIARLRSRALALPPHVLAEADDWRAPIAQALRSAEAVARLGGRPGGRRLGRRARGRRARARAVRRAGGGAAARPHDDPQPARRIARRILQRLNGMGKWGGYHTDFRHLSRGFAGNERALADEVGEALIAAGLLDEKPSVGQRHVFLNSRRAADIHALIDRGDVPPDLRLP